VAAKRSDRGGFTSSRKHLHGVVLPSRVVPRRPHLPQTHVANIMAQRPGWSGTSASSQVDSAAAKRRVPNLHRLPPSSSLPGAPGRSSSSGGGSFRCGIGPRAVWRRRRNSRIRGSRPHRGLSRSIVHRPGTSGVKHASSWSHSHFFAETGGRGHAIALWLVRPEDRRGASSYHTTGHRPRRSPWSPAGSPGSEPHDSDAHTRSPGPRRTEEDGGLEPRAAGWATHAHDSPGLGVRVDDRRVRRAAGGTGPAHVLGPGRLDRMRPPEPAAKDASTPRPPGRRRRRLVGVPPRKDRRTVGARRALGSIRFVLPMPVRIAH